jgi:hypothetical protein
MLLSELRVKISADAAGLTQGVRSADASLGRLSHTASTASTRIATLAPASAAAGTGLSVAAGGARAAAVSFAALEATAAPLLAALAPIAILAGAAAFLSKASTAADELQASQRRLAATAALLRQNLGFLQLQSRQTGEDFDLTARVANDLMGSMARLTAQAGQMNRTGAATAAWLDLAAANSIGAAESMDALRLTILGQDEGLNKLGLANPSAIYQSWARAAGTTAGKLTDTQKAQALLDAVIAAGARVRGEYLRFLETAPGRTETLAARTEELEVSVGKAFNGMRLVVLPVLSDIMSGLNLSVLGMRITAIRMGEVFEAIAAGRQRLDDALHGRSTVGRGGVDAGIAGIRARADAQVSALDAYRARVSAAARTSNEAVARAIDESRGFVTPKGNTDPLDNLLSNLRGAGAGGADKLAAAREQVQGLVRDFELLAKFSGAANLGNLPDEFQQQIRLARALEDQVAQAQRQIAQLGASAPSGSQSALDNLNRQLTEAQRRLDEFARRWNDPTLLGRANIRVPELPGMTAGAPRAAQVLLNTAAAQKSLDALTASVKSSSEAFKATIGALNAALAAGLQQVAAGSSQFLGDAIQMGSQLAKNGASFAAAGPQALAFAAAMKVAAGFFSVVGPAIEALMLPLTIAGEILGALIVPVLRILWGPLKLLGIIVSYLGQAVAKVAEWITTAIGLLVRGIGRLVNKLPGSPGDPLVKAGQAMLDLGKQFKNAGDEIAKKRKELEGLSFEDAMDRASGAVDRFSEAMLNAVEGFKIERFRFAAMDARQGWTPPPKEPRAGAVSGGPSVPTQSVSVSGLSIPVVINTTGDGDETYRGLYRVLDREARSHPAFRPIFALFPKPA